MCPINVGWIIEQEKISSSLNSNLNAFRATTPLFYFRKKVIYAIEKLLCLWVKLISGGFLCIYHIHVLGSNMKLWRLIQLVKIAQGNYQYNLHLSVLHTYKDWSILDRLIYHVRNGLHTPHCQPPNKPQWQQSNSCRTLNITHNQSPNYNRFFRMTIKYIEINHTC